MAWLKKPPADAPIVRCAGWQQIAFQLLDSELCEQQALRRFEILEGNRLVVETLVQRSEIGEHIILRSLRGQSRLCFLS